MFGRKSIEFHLRLVMNPLNKIRIILVMYYCEVR